MTEDKESNPFADYLRKLRKRNDTLMQAERTGDWSKVEKKYNIRDRVFTNGDSKIKVELGQNVFPPRTGVRKELASKEDPDSITVAVPKNAKNHDTIIAFLESLQQEQVNNKKHTLPYFKTAQKQSEKDKMRFAFIGPYIDALNGNTLSSDKETLAANEIDEIRGNLLQNIATGLKQANIGYTEERGLRL